jgi:hypothetical protein
MVLAERCLPKDWNAADLAQLSSDRVVDVTATLSHLLATTVGAPLNVLF